MKKAFTTLAAIGLLFVTPLVVADSCQTLMDSLQGTWESNPNFYTDSAIKKQNNKFYLTAVVNEGYINVTYASTDGLISDGFFVSGTCVSDPEGQLMLVGEKTSWDGTTNKIVMHAPAEDGTVQENGTTNILGDAVGFNLSAHNTSN